MRAAGLSLLAVLLATPVCAQESQLAADVRREGEALRKDCTVKTLTSCIVDLATEEPFHVAVGSLAPQSGFGFGGAFVEHYTPEGGNWKYSWDVDAVTTAPAGSWRAGAYMKLVRDAVPPIGVVAPGAARQTRSRNAYPIFNLYVQSSSLDKLLFFGEGPNSTQSGRSVFKETQTIVGGSGIVPVRGPLNASFLFGLNGRFVQTTGTSVSGVPPIDQIYDPAAAPGLNLSSTFAQFQGGIRVKPRWLGSHVNTNYSAVVDQFVSDSETAGSFHRWTINIDHSIPLFRDIVRPSETNGPDSCRDGLGATAKCPRVSFSRNREGAIDVRAFVTSSAASAGNMVPFYLQPTLGGSDINGNMMLASFDDYRFRASNLFAFQESVEYSIWGPIGAYLLLEQGKVADRVGDFGSSNLLYSAAVGVTIRAGGFPLINLAFAWGGGEGTHNIVRMDSSLLGAGSRPSLF